MRITLLPLLYAACSKEYSDLSQSFSALEEGELMRKYVKKNILITVVLLILTAVLLAVPQKTYAASRYPFRYFKVGGRNITSRINRIVNDAPPARFFDGIMEVSAGSTLRKGSRICWKMNSGWHASIYYGNGRTVRNWSRLKSFDYSDWGLEIYAWKGSRSRRARNHREILFNMLR